MKPLPNQNLSGALIALLILITGFKAYSSSFYSKSSSDICTPSNWNTATNGSGTDAIASDFTGGNTFIIQGGHSMTMSGILVLSGSGAGLQLSGSASLSISSALNVPMLFIASGSQATIGPGVTLTISNGNPTGYDLQVSGILSSGGIVSYGSGATGTFLASSTYQHTYTSTSGSVPTANWNSTSTCLITGYTTNASTPGGLAQALGNFTWNCPSQSTNINAGGNLTNINGSLTISSTGSGSFRLAAGTGPTVSIGADLVIESGTLNLSSGAGSTSVYLNGDLQINSGAVLTETGSSNAKIYFYRNGTQNFTLNGSFLNDIFLEISESSKVQLLTDMLINTGESITVKGSLETGNFSVSGSGGLIMEDGSELITSHAAGITGAIGLTGTLSFSPNAGYTFNGNNQSMNFAENGITEAGCLTVNSSGTITLDTNLVIHDSLYFLAGKMSLESSNLSLPQGGACIGYGSGSYLITNGTGVVSLAITAGSSGYFPIGTSDYFHPALISLSVSSAPDTFSIRVSPGVLDGGTSGTPITVDIVDATWFVSESNPGSSSISLNLSWPEAAELGGFDRTNCFVSGYSGGWSGASTGNAAGTGPYSMSRSGITTLTQFSVGDQSSPLPVIWGSVKAEIVEEGVKLIWNTVSEYNNDRFIVEYSYNGIDFISADSLHTRGNSPLGWEYQLIHYYEVGNMIYYRVKQVDADGFSTFSRVISCDLKLPALKSRIFYNGENIIIRSENPIGKIVLSNCLGMIIYEGNYREIEIVLNVPIPPGLYLIDVDGSIYKFIKNH